MTPQDKLVKARKKARQARENRSAKESKFLNKFDVPDEKKQELEAPDEKYYLTPRGIAENLGISYQVVMKHLHLAAETEGQEGLRHRRKGPRYVVSEEDFEDWYDKYIAG
ncbi:MAG: hypothetical protein GF399_03830 [Candidatus Coatesbacteria bacterium]|nr:hypothetical protein [Candidatus Coatesbacteria bacterium]